MSEQTIQHAFLLCSILLSYPDREFIDSFEEIVGELELWPDSAMKNDIGDFLHRAGSLAPSELITTYVNTFDFGKKTNLYMSNGEQRERGMDLLFLKNYYKLHGLSVTDKELPDYLPIMLEFASQVDRADIKPVFERYLEKIKEVEINLDREENLYRHIFKAILSALKEAGVVKR